MKYESVDAAAAHHQSYPSLDKDLAEHDFQRRRVRSSSKFILPGDVVLDIACNTGYFWDYCPQAREVHGVDVNPSLVEQAKTRLTTAQVARAEALPFPDKTFDVVNLSGILEQVHEPLPILQEAARVARRAVLGNTTHATGTWGKHRTERHQWQSRSYTEDEIRELLDAIGRISFLGTVDVNNPPEPQCWYWEVRL